MGFLEQVMAFIQTHTEGPVSLKANLVEIPSLNLTFCLKEIASATDDTPPGSRIIWEDQWLSQQPIVKSQLLSTLGKTQRIHGRETELKKVTQPEATVFLNENHLLGATPAKTKLALMLNGKIVALATFSGPTKIDRSGTRYKSYELIRYCPLIGHTVVGGLSKLLNHFIRSENPDDIMTYVDKGWSTGESYRRLGFEKTAETPPQEFWIDPVKMTRYNAREEKSPLKSFIRIKNMGNFKFIRFLK